jgi:hypothetical protein
MGAERTPTEKGRKNSGMQSETRLSQGDISKDILFTTDTVSHPPQGVEPRGNCGSSGKVPDEFQTTKKRKH